MALFCGEATMDKVFILWHARPSLISGTGKET
jgi:hypothetical protein